MNSRRGSTASPISVVKMSSAATASSTRTWSRRRTSGLIVVSRAARIHFAESLVALDRLSLARLIEKPAHGLRESGNVLAPLAAGDVGACADEVVQGRPEFGDATILRRFEEFGLQVLFGRDAVLGARDVHTVGLALLVPAHGKPVAVNDCHRR